MKIYNGKIHLIGSGVYNGGSGGSGGTQVSVLEIGDEVLKRIFISDYLSNYLRVGDEVSLLVFNNLNKHALLGVKVNNKTYKTPLSSILVLFILKMIVFAVIVGGLGIFIADVQHMPLIKFAAILSSLVYIGLKIKALVQLNNF